jgi:hypothetical protein
LPSRAVRGLGGLAYAPGERRVYAVMAYPPRRSPVNPRTASTSLGELPEGAYRARAAVIQINPTPTPLSRIATVNFYGKAGAIVTALLKQVWHIDVDTVNLG